MVTITVGGPLALAFALVGALLIYRDAKQRGMDTADMWAVGFFIGFFVPPLIGAAVVVALYFRNREPRRGYAYGVDEV